jgi:predicted AAA+ superfamily ATPase
VYSRHLTTRLLNALGDMPVVLVHGARQTGKSTLVQSIAAGPHRARYLTLDEAPVLVSAKADPAGFIAGLHGSVVIDEVQRAPELFLPIKAAVDRSRRPGAFLLTGSANIFLIPRLSESLAGRMIVLTLYPLTQSEIENTNPGLVDHLFGRGSLPTTAVATNRSDVVDRIVRGGYPESVARRPNRRAEWFGAYVTAILQRDIRDLAQRVERLTEFPRLLEALAARTGTLLNAADLARMLGLPYMTLRRYLSLLEATFLVHLVPAWTKSPRRRFLKSPKAVLLDTGLAAHLMGAGPERAASDPALLGSLLETFVITEVLKEATWSRAQPAAYHYRAVAGDEVDLVLEDRAGRVVGIEVKAAASLGERDFGGLRGLADAAGANFHRGVLFYLGNTVLPFGSRLTAMPVPCLWTPTQA